MSLILALVAVAVGLPGAVAAVHLGVLTAASLAYRQPAPTPVPRVRFLVVIPAHDEERVVAATLSSVLATARPGDRVLVVADRCTDRTAEIARAAGVEVLERGSDRPAGRAQALRDGLAFAAEWEWDAYVSIDADSVVDGGFFDALERALAASAGAAQARSESLPGRGPLAHAAVAAFAAQGVTIPRGRDRLGLSVRLRGSGMALRRDLLDRYDYRTAGASEDLWFSLDLCLDGVLARHADGARLRSSPASGLRAAGGQRRRWEAGRMLAAREFLRPLLRRRTPAAFEAAVHLVTPPVAVAAFSLATAAGLAGIAGWTPLTAAFTLLLALLVAAIAVTMVQARVPLRTWLALPLAPLYVLWKVWLQLRAAAGIGRARQPYAPTPRS